MYSWLVDSLFKLTFRFVLFNHLDGYLEHKHLIDVVTPITQLPNPIEVLYFLALNVIEEFEG